jgi:excisionase family DNA binding protein
VSNDGLFLTVEEAAERLNLNPETIRRRIRRGQIKAQLLPGPRGDQYSIPVSELTTQEAQIVPVPQLSPVVLSQLSQAVAAPLAAKIDQQAAEITELKVEIEKLRIDNAGRSMEMHRRFDELIEETRADRKARQQRSWWKFWG